ncbi:MAG: aminotransferase class I/II-fold pyridoxal phosphate-dependent enzyme [Erysipelotrichaceae bacterium]|nr:aminotransferase class I/II-fold pyridoxal phosphate-dependent enzyme [Erysipelotrichaceae bacterium]
MKLPDFKVEQWMNVYENDAVFNLTDTCVAPLTFEELSAMDETQSFMRIKLDYGTITGDENLKQQILSLYTSGNTDEITLMQGCLQANESVIYTLLSPGDRVIVYEPGYQQFSDLPLSIGAKITSLKLYEENGWQPDLQELEKAFEENIRMVIVNQPANPTGVIFSGEYREKLIELCRKQNAYILSDEVYRGLDDEPSFSDLYEKGISTSSLSKIFSLAGLRLGWIKGPKEVIDAVNVRRDYSIISTGPLIDSLACTALKNKEKILERSRSIINANKEIVEEFLKKHQKFHMVMPSSGTVGFLGYDYEIDDTMLAKQLLKETGVFFVPGSCFGCEKHLRLGLTCSGKTMETGLAKLAEFIESI